MTKREGPLSREEQARNRSEFFADLAAVMKKHGAEITIDSECVGYGEWRWWMDVNFTSYAKYGVTYSEFKCFDEKVKE